MFLRAFIAALSVLILVGCSVAPAPGPSTSSTVPATTSDTALAGIAQAQNLASPVASCPAGQFADARGICLPCLDYEGCFTQATDMYYFLNAGIGLIERYGTDTFPAGLDPVSWTYVPTGVTGDEACTDPKGGRAKYSDQSYEYCPMDRVIYVGEQEMWQFYSANGDAAPIVGLAHEWGHHLQNVAGIVVRRSTEREDTLAEENQADCVAGAWTDWARRNQILDLEDDLKDIGGLIVAIADHGAERTHGTLAERVEAFNTGYRKGISACNEFVDWAALIPLPGPTATR